MVGYCLLKFKIITSSHLSDHGIRVDRGVGRAPLFTFFVPTVIVKDKWEIQTKILKVRTDIRTHSTDKN